MNKTQYQTWIEQGQQWADSALDDTFAQNPQRSDTFDQAQLCFVNAQDVHWQAYLNHQRFQLSANEGQVSQAYRFGRQTHRQYTEAFDPKGKTLFLIHWAHFLSTQGSENKALSELRAAVVLAKAHAPERLGLALSSLGAEYLAQGNFGRAIEQLDLSLASGALSDPELPWCFKALADAFRGLYQLNHAETLYRKALKKSLESGQLGIAGECRSLLLELEQTLNTDFSFSELGLKSKSVLQST